MKDLLKLLIQGIGFSKAPKNAKKGISALLTLGRKTSRHTAGPLLMLLSASLVALAGCRKAPSASPFASDFIASLSHIKMCTQHLGQSASLQQKSQGFADIAVTTAMLTEDRLGLNELVKAKAFLTKYSKSDKKEYKQGAEAMLDSITAMEKWLNLGVEVLIDLGRKRSPKEIAEFDPMKYSDAASRIAAGLDQTYDSMTLASVIATYGLIEFPNGKPPSRLAMTEAERQNFIKEIESLFPDVKGGLKAYRMKADGGAAVFDQVLRTFSARPSAQGSS